ncbi:MAG: hypothetical protein MMC23_006285 [Stictis urceolatum]|nr:hypothetical protein [Stictis urceolata]
MGHSAALHEKPSYATVGRASTLHAKSSATTIGDASTLHDRDFPDESVPDLPDLSSMKKHKAAPDDLQYDSKNNETDTSDQEKQSAPPPGIPSPSDFPDGGLEAWSVVIGGFFCLFTTFGWINATGIFQEYYQTELLSSYSPSTVAWIVSLETFFMFFGGPFIGWFFDCHGPRLLLLVGSFLHVFGLMMTSLSTQYYQLLLAQGICSPVGASMVFYSAMNSVVTWFFKKRAYALGITAAGSSLGGIIFPIMMTHLIPQIGFPWAMRAAAFLILGCLVIANLTVRARLPPSPRPFRPRVFIKPLSEAAFGLLSLSSFLIFFGLFIPFNYVSLSALSNGMSSNLAQYMLPILNAASVFGRTLPGYVGDKVGRFNVTITMCALSGIIILALWLPATANAPVIVFAVLYGFGSGAFVSMVPALVAQVSDIREIGVRTGTVFAIVSLGALCGNPIAGALLDKDKGEYTYLQAFSGGLICGGTVVMVITRLVITKGVVWTKM